MAEISEINVRRSQGVSACALLLSAIVRCSQPIVPAISLACRRNFMLVDVPSWAE